MKKLKIGTLFSGIGAFEEALKQLNIPFEIMFACDNGEIELIPLDDKKERKQFLDFQRRVRSLSNEEKETHKALKEKISQKNEEIRTLCYSIPTKVERTEYVNELYKKYEGLRTNWMKQTYLLNNKNYIHKEDFHTDVRFMKGSDYEGLVDIIVGGSPCQSFSTFGKKQGLEDARGTLFYDYARIIQEVKPKIFIYENVSSVLSIDKKRTWSRMLDVINSLGYEFKYDIINAVDHDHPQLRKRLFLIGFRKDIYKNDCPYVFPEKKDLTHTCFEYLEKEVPNKYYLGEGGFKWITTPEKNKRRSRVNQKIIGCQTANQQDNWIGDFRVERPLQRHYEDERIFIGQYDFGRGLEDAVGRKMTPRECLNLMGFSKDFKFEVSDKIAYRLAGNAIVVPVLKDIIETILPYIGETC